MLLSALLCYLGFTALCLSMDKHHSELLNGKPGVRRRRGLKIGGWLLLVLSVCLSVNQRGWGMGLVEWSATLMASVLLLVFLMPYKPRWILQLAVAGVVLVPVAALL